MATRYPKSSHTGDKAVHFIKGICIDSEQAIFRAILETDLGIDGDIHLLNQNGEPTGAFAHIQSKGGLSRVTKSGRYKIQTDKKHFETWSRYKQPIIGIIYNPELDDARWVSITEYLQSHPNCIESGPYVIYAPPDQPFSLEGFAKFQRYVTAHYEQIGTDSAQKLIDQYFRGDTIQKYECLVQLFSEYRWTPTSCLFFHYALRLEEEPTILHALTYFISYYRPFVWRLSGTMPENDVHLRSLAQKCFADFGEKEVLKMMSTVNQENEEHSLRDLVAIQLKYIPNIKEILRVIAGDSFLEPLMRGYAILILAGFLDYFNASFYQSLLQSENDSYVIETLQWALERGIEESAEDI